MKYYPYKYKDLRDTLADAVFKPRISEEKLAERVEAIKRRLPIPVIWLLDKAQSGKTSLIRALTGRDDTEIGNGFQPCTRTARLYDFPDTALCRDRQYPGAGVSVALGR
jgi:hypothetical protein